MDPVEVDPKSFPKFQIFVECTSINKLIKKDSAFLYQVFPSTLRIYHETLISACSTNDLNIVKRLVKFFSTFNTTFINMSQIVTLNTALHVAASHGHFVTILVITLNLIYFILTV